MKCQDIKFGRQRRCIWKFGGANSCVWCRNLGYVGAGVNKDAFLEVYEEYVQSNEFGQSMKQKSEVQSEFAKKMGDKSF